MPAPDQPRTVSPWVVTEGLAGESGIPQLFCFAHAGGGPSFFRPWRAALAPEIAVCPIALPGRESRLDERPFRHITELVEPLGAALLPQLDRPYALFGHSMGAVAAYEVARWLTGHARAGPACLLVSGRRAPGTAPTRQRISELPDDQFLAAVRQLNGIPPEVLREPELLSMLLPALRADFELAETYQPLPGDRLSCPVAAYLSTSDPEVTPAGVLGWQEMTTGEFSVRVFRGDHFYLKGDRPDVLSAVREDLRRSRRAPPARPPAAAR
jgi:medium-chain acyl-[acyl-carrier-protein] hydrolase